MTTKKKKVSMKEDLMQKLEDHRNILKPEEYVELLALIEEASESDEKIIHVIGQRLGYTKCLLLHNHDFTDVVISYYKSVSKKGKEVLKYHLEHSSRFDNPKHD